MGVASAIPYDISVDINHFPDTHSWKLHDGRKKDVVGVDASDDHAEVSIFSLKKSKNPTEVARLALAQKGCQRLKSLKHPYVLGFIESTEMEDSFLMVTEHAIPIHVWLKSYGNHSDSNDLEIVWGLKCLFEALHFLHSKCHVTHCNISPHSCFYTKNGDWKLGVFDLACNVSTEGTFFEEIISLQETGFSAPESLDGSWKSLYVQHSSGDAALGGSGKKCGWAIDVFAMGKLLQAIYDAVEGTVTMPKCLEGPLKRMLSPDSRRRPTCASLLKSSCFHAEELKLMSTICELQLKPPLECIDVFTLLKEKIDLISKAVCTFKILPCLGNMLTRSITDFQVRDNRETCRRIVHTSLELLAHFGDQNKIDEGTFGSCCLAAYQQLWTFSDRAIRTVLLRTLKSILYLLSRDTVNKKLFDPLLSGFSDSNSKLREDTLKSLVDVVEKLDESQLQDKLVRCICNLQNDAEASVRTNAVIFLSRITNKLTPSVRHRVLAGSYCKAMKDPFVHCRIAGLKATEASMTLFDMNQICTRLIPQISLLLLDKSHDVNELALSALVACTQQVREGQEDNKRVRALTSTPSNLSSSSTVTNSGGVSKADVGAGGGKSDWTAWALDGITKSMEKVTSEDVPTIVDPLPVVERDNIDNTSVRTAAITSPHQKESVAKDGWGDDDDDIDIDDLIDEVVPKVESDICKESTLEASSTSFSDRPPTAKLKKSRKEASSKKAVTTVKKLSVDPNETESWDDF